MKPKRGRPLLSVDDIKARQLSVRLNARQADKLRRISAHYTIANATLVRVALQNFFDNSEEILGKLNRIRENS